MGASAPLLERPATVSDCGALLAELGRARRPVRARGGATKLAWSRLAVDPEVEVSTAGLARILEHNEGDFTLVVQAGARLADVGAELARAGQMLALDPPLGEGDGATVGGILATADSGPLRHRYGAARDLILGVTVALSDGTIAHAGGKVIKNVAGYDLAKLFTGSFGALGLIAEVSLRLHPLPETTATFRAQTDVPAALAGVATRLAAMPLEADCLDVNWAGGAGELLVRFGGRTAGERAHRVAGVAEAGGLTGEVLDDDAEIWELQRRRQRSGEEVVLKLTGVIGGLEAVLGGAEDLGASVVSRVGLGLSWLRLTRNGAPQAIAELRERLPDVGLTVLDGAPATAGPPPSLSPGVLTVMSRLKARFDPAGIFPPGPWERA